MTYTLGDIGNILAAIAALGTAAFGLVDASKAFDGGVSNAGFGYIRDAVARFLGANAVLGQQDVWTTLRANWLNGLPKADQKAVAKSLIRLSLTAGNAPRLAQATGVDAAGLAGIADSVAQGRQLAPQQITLLGQFDTVVSAGLDAGYERADQAYRNTARLASAVVAIVMAEIATPLVTDFTPGNAVLAFLVGAISTPLAPVAKDLASTLQAAAKAVTAVRRP